MSLPPSIHSKRGKNASERRHRNEPGFTPTELATKARLMKQFTKLEGPSGSSKAYVESPVWCDHPGCKRTRGTHEH